MKSEKWPLAGSKVYVTFSNGRKQQFVWNDVQGWYELHEVSEFEDNEPTEKVERKEVFIPSCDCGARTIGSSTHSSWCSEVNGG